MRNIHQILSVICVFILIFLLNPTTASGQSVSPEFQDDQSQTPDVMILVFPTSFNTAKVGLSFHQLVPHNQVKKEISLLASNGWVIGPDTGIEDRSIRPGAPVVTGAHFSIEKAPQVVNNVPMLRPYVQAFQAWNHVDVLFNLAELKPYNGVETFDSAAVSVRHVPEENAYHYEVTIRDHKGPLPEFTGARFAEGGSLTNGRPSSSNTVKNLPIPLLPLMLILLGGGLLGGLGIYALLTRHQATTSSARNARL